MVNTDAKRDDCTCLKRIECSGPYEDYLRADLYPDRITDPWCKIHGDKGLKKIWI